MNCTSCGTQIPAGSGFCPSCGAPVPAEPPVFAYPQPSAPTAPATPPAPAAPTQPLPVTPPAPVAPTQQMPVVQPAQPQPQQPVSQPNQQPAQPYAQPQAPPAPRKGLSGGVIAAIVAGVIVLLLVVVVGGIFAVRTIRSRVADGAARLTEAPTTTAPAEQPAAEAPAEQPPAAEEPPAEEPAASQDGIITDEQARATVTAFLDARLAGDVETSRQYCTNSYWNGEFHDMLVDATWRPETYEIVNSRPDLMYVHVVVLTNWPSGDEYWIWSCLIDPSTAKPLIDGTLDPANVPELIPQ